MLPTDSIRAEKHSIMASDETLLSATLYRPANHNNHAILIAGAMGMPQRFYRHYASFLAEQGCVVLTFDFRGMAESLGDNPIRGYQTNLQQWATQDLQAMIQWLTGQYFGTELTLIGHSLGALLPGTTSNIKHVKSLIGVSSGNIYNGKWSGIGRIRMLLFAYLFVPLLSNLMNYFPSAWFGLGDPLPRDIALDWGRAIRHPMGIKGLFAGTSYNHYGDFTGYSRFYSFTDDDIAPKKAIDAVLDYYSSARHQERKHISPESIGKKKIGHIGFFRPEMKDTLWQESLTWLLNVES